MENQESQELWQIGEVARQAGTTVRTVRYYMEEGFIEPAARSAGGFYLFYPGTADTVFFVQKLRNAGFALKEIKALYDARKNGATGHEASSRVLAILKEQKRVVEQKIAAYQKLDTEIQEALDLVRNCQECPRVPTRETCRKCSVLASRKKLPLPVQAII